MVIAYGWVLSSPVRGQTLCAPRDEIIKRLKGQYGERPHSGGITANNLVTEVWVNPVNRSWTLLLTKPDGESCVLAAGDDWDGKGVSRDGSI